MHLYNVYCIRLCHFNELSIHDPRSCYYLLYYYYYFYREYCAGWYRITYTNIPYYTAAVHASLSAFPLKKSQLLNIL